MNCPKCNAVIDGGSVICHVCGQRIDLEGQTTEVDRPEDDVPATATTPESPAEAAGMLPVSEQPAPARPSGARQEEDWTEGPWYYSAKAMRGAFLLTGLATLLFVAFGIFLAAMGWMPESWRGTLLVWGILLGIPACLWLYQFGVCLYRTKTIRYSLTPYRLIHEDGLLVRRKQVIELFDIDDIEHSQSVWERFVCGNLGTITIHSSDPGTPVLVIRGLANHNEAFQKIDHARRKQREKRGLKMI